MQTRMPLAAFATGTFLAQIQLVVHQDPQVLFCKAVLWLVSLHHVQVPGLIALEVRAIYLC